jgi:uncharacterized protein (TIGR03435 family)
MFLSAVVLFAVALPPVALTQTTPELKPLSFDAVSIHPSTVSRDASAMRWQFQPDGFIAENVPIITILYLAFPEEVAITHSFKNVPGWVTSDRYDLIAKVAPEDVKAWQKVGHARYDKPLLEPMLQAVLADRCKLTFHLVPAEFAGHALVVDKPSPQLLPTDPAAPQALTGIALSGGGRAVFTGKDENQGQWAFHNATLTDLARFLSDSGLVTRDRTGLPTRYDFVLSQEPYDPPEPTPGMPAPPRQPATWNLKPLGLRLIPAKVTVSTVVIDHIERPTAN